MNDPSWTSVLPSLVAIVVAVGTRQVYLALAGGLWLGWAIVNDWNFVSGLAAAIESTVSVLGSAGDARVILFTLVIGALMATIHASGGVAGFVQRLERARWVEGGRRAQALAWAIGVIIFIESNITILVAGAVSRPLFDRFRVSREKLAYIIDSTSAPICILIPLNAWGAYNLGLLSAVGVEDPLGVFFRAIFYNFYPLAAVGLALIVIVFRLDWGAMKRAEDRAKEGIALRPGSVSMMDSEILGAPVETSLSPRARNMIAPLVVLALVMPLGLWITGEGDLRAGSGSTSVLWASLAGLATSWVALLAQRAFSIETLMTVALKGAGAMFPLALVLLLAFALGNVAEALGAGAYVARLSADMLPTFLFLPGIFLVASVISFSIGSSWGTFAIMIPIAVPAAEVFGADPSPFLAAALSGGIFGDHCSPISDTTIISSMAAATDHVDHVRTQLPYALVGGLVALLGFTVVGALL